MLNQIKYALLDIKNSKIINLLFVIEMIIILFIVNMISTDTIKINHSMHMMEKLSEQNAYVNGDMTSNEKVNSLINDQDKSIPAMKKLYSFVADNYVKYSYWEYDTGKYVDQQSIKLAVTDKSFFDIYNINTVYGRMFSNEDFSEDSNIVKVVIGFNLKDTYSIGKQYTEIDPNTGEEFTFEVIGVLKHNSSYPSLYQIGSNYDLNYTFFRPINNNLLNDFANLDMALGSLVVFNNDEKSVKKIEMMSTELDLFRMNFSKIESNISEFFERYNQKLMIELIILLVVLSFTVFSMVFNMMSILKKNSRDFAIHLICGAKISNICFRFFIQLIFLNLIAYIPTVIYNIYNKTSVGFIYTIIFGIILSLIITAFPSVKLYKKNLVLVTRREK